MEKIKRVYQCEDSIDGILSAVYVAGVSKYGHDYIEIQAQTKNSNRNFDFFTEYIMVENNSIQVEKVIRSIQEKISLEAYEYVMRGAITNHPHKGNIIYHFIVAGFHMGKQVTKALQNKWVCEMFQLDRMVKNEVHHYLGFLRFQEVQKEPSLLLGIFEPENRITSFVTPHFADRLNPEWFIIYDKVYMEASFHSPGKPWYIRQISEEEGKILESIMEKNEKYTDLWKVFFQSITIEERKNKKLQQNNLPLRFRSYMTEFQEEKNSTKEKDISKIQTTMKSVEEI